MDLPRETGTYRVMAVSSRDAAVWRTSTKVWFADGQFKSRTATLSVSYDDAAWRQVPLSRTADGRWTAKFTTPHRPGSFVSLRPSATGPGGLHVNQEIIRAFGLKHRSDRNRAAPALRGRGRSPPCPRRAGGEG